LGWENFWLNDRDEVETRRRPQGPLLRERCFTIRRSSPSLSPSSMRRETIGSQP